MVNRFVSFLAPEHPNNRIESLEICCVLVETNVLGIPEIQQHELPQKVTTLYFDAITAQCQGYEKLC